MAKTRTVYFCQSCGYESAKWLGKCPACNAWNTFAEELLSKEPDNKNEWRQESSRAKQTRPRTLKEIESAGDIRWSSADQELDRVLGGGVVPGSLVLIGGEPGIGKSTLMLQAGLRLKEQAVLYVSGEESEQQIKMRAERLGDSSPSFFILTETNTKNIFQVVESLKPDLHIIESI